LPYESNRDRVFSQHSAPATRWQENHGSLLLTFVAAVLVIGALILTYRQNRFVPVRFPEGDMIDVPQEPPPAEDNSASMTIRVIGAANDFGMMMIAIYGSEETFNQPAAGLAAQSVPIVEGQAVLKVPVERLPARIAIAAYHDENGDSDLNRNRLGIPSERYGFSRNARGLTGPPSFKQAVINRPAAGETIELYVR
jgi:uncharacterized protein (DUF2141 family)